MSPVHTTGAGVSACAGNLGNLPSGGRVVLAAADRSRTTLAANNPGSGRGCFVEFDRRKSDSRLAKCSCFAGIAHGWRCSVPSPRSKYLTLGRGNTEGPRRSGELVAPAGWSALLSCISDNLASTAVARLGTSFHYCGKALDLGRRCPVDLRHDFGGGASSPASR
jgi:hypothetical protein